MLPYPLSVPTKHTLSSFSQWTWTRCKSKFEPNFLDLLHDVRRFFHARTFFFSFSFRCSRQVVIPPLFFYYFHFSSLLGKTVVGKMLQPMLDLTTRLGFDDLNSSVVGFQPIYPGNGLIHRRESLSPKNCTGIFVNYYIITIKIVSSGKSIIENVA